MSTAPLQAVTAGRQQFATPFGRYLYEKRLATGWTQKELCSAAGLTPSHVARLEGGFGHPCDETCGKLARALRCDESEMIGVAEASRLSGQGRRQAAREQARKNTQDSTCRCEVYVPLYIVNWLESEAQRMTLDSRGQRRVSKSALASRFLMQAYYAANPAPSPVIEGGT